MNTIRVLTADPHPVTRAGLRVILGAVPGVEVVGEPDDGPSALRLAGELDPDVIVLEVALPGLGGAEHHGVRATLTPGPPLRGGWHPRCTTVSGRP